MKDRWKLFRYGGEEEDLKEKKLEQAWHCFRKLTERSRVGVGVLYSWTHSTD